jgi:two-component system chemotaxis sensor kinase CheA
LLAAFVPESRDLLRAATAGLRRLQRDARDEAVINEVFRAVHTLQGSSGLFDAAPLTRLLHVAEHLLGEVRAGRLALTSFMVDALRDALGQAGLWVDALERHAGLPDDAEAAAGERVAVLRALMPAPAGGAPGAEPAARRPDTDWLPVLDDSEHRAVARHQAAGQPVVAIRYTPDEAAFYRGEDPLHLLRQLPGLLALRIAPRTPWPAVAALDPYRCNLVFHALAAAPHEVVAQLFRYAADQAEIVALSAAADAESPAALRAQLLVEQRRVLALPADDAAEMRRRIAAVAGTLGSLLHGAGPAVAQPDFDAAVSRALETGRAAPLLALLDHLQSPPAGKATSR